MNEIVWAISHVPGAAVQAGVMGLVLFIVAGWCAEIVRGKRGQR